MKLQDSKVHARRSSEDQNTEMGPNQMGLQRPSVDTIRNLSTSIRCQEDEDLSSSKINFDDVNVRLKYIGMSEGLKV